MELCYCRTCRELCYSPTSGKGVFDSMNAAFNHAGHDIVRLVHPERYAPPIRLVLAKLAHGDHVTDNEIVMFRLAIDLGGLEDPQDSEKSSAPCIAQGADK